MKQYDKISSGHSNHTIASAAASLSHRCRTVSNIFSHPSPFLATSAGSKSIRWPSLDFGGCELSIFEVLGRWSSTGEGPGVQDGRLDTLGIKDEVEVV